MCNASKSQWIVTLLLFFGLSACNAPFAAPSPAPMDESKPQPEIISSATREVPVANEEDEHPVTSLPTTAIIEETSIPSAGDRNIDEIYQVDITEVSDFEISPDGATLAVAGEEGLRLYDLIKMENGQFIEDDPMSVVSWSPDGLRLASGGQDPTFKIWEAGSWLDPANLEGHLGSGVSLSWSPDGTNLVTVAYDTSIRIWDTSTGRQLLQSNDITQGIRHVSWSPNGDYFATGSFDGTVRLWSADEGVMVRMLGQHALFLNCVAWSPDGLRLASGGSDGILRIWDIQSGDELFSLEYDGGEIDSIAWSADGSKLVTAGGWVGIGNLVLWETNEGRILHTKSHDAIFTDIGWLPGSDLLLAVSYTGELLFWDLAE